MDKIKGLNILFVSAHFPLPLIGGERIKQYNIIKYLAEDNNVVITSLDRGLEVRAEDISNFKSMNIDAYSFHINRIKAYINAAVFSPFGNPMEIEFFRNKQLKLKIIEIVKKNNIDLIFNYFLRTAEFVKDIDLPKILLAEDCRSYYQARTYKVTKNLKQKIIRFCESRKLRKYESKIMDFFDVTTVVTDEDYEQMKLLNPSANIAIISNGVDIQMFSPPENTSARKDLLFVGKLNCWTNILMVRRIVREILPEIFKKELGVIMHIVGAKPTKEILKYQNKNIQVHPDVNDITAFYRRAAVFLHPHEGGSGIQNKVLEAMSCGCPVITTKSGSRGIKIISGENGYIAETNSDFVDYTLNLIKDKNKVNDVSLKSRKTILENYQWEHIYHDLENVMRFVLNNKDKVK